MLKRHDMNEIEQKLKYILDEVLEANSLLLVSIRTLYKEEPKENKLYFPVSVLILCFCFLDFLKRVDYIMKNGKDGKEDKNNAKNYKNFLEEYIIGNCKYNEYKFSFTSDMIYDYRCELIHSFSIREGHAKDEIGITFIWGKLGEVGRIKRELEKKGCKNKVEVISAKKFLDIIKEGVHKMLREHENLLTKESSKEALKNLSDLYNDLEGTTRYYVL